MGPSREVHKAAERAESVRAKEDAVFSQTQRAKTARERTLSGDYFREREREREREAIQVCNGTGGLSKY